MNLAQRFERRLESLVGSAFARVFKGQVEPVEVGAALQREAADQRAVMGAGQVMVPNRYRVTLSTDDYERLAPWEAQLANAFAELVQDHIDENGWLTLGDIEVYLARDDSLHTGIFGVASRMESDVPPRSRPHDSLSLPAVPDLGPSATVSAGPDYDDYQPYDQAYEEPAPQYGEHYQQAYAPSVHYVLTVDGLDQRHRLHAGSNVVGRSQDAHVRLADQGVSRRHVEVYLDGHSAVARDLGSTNGTSINGHTVTVHTLAHGDVIRIGNTRLVFQQESG